MQKKGRCKTLDIELECCDFRTVSGRFSGKFDCVASTGNSLLHVNNEEVLKTLEQMDALVKPGGQVWDY